MHRAFCAFALSCVCTFAQLPKPGSGGTPGSPGPPGSVNSVAGSSPVITGGTAIDPIMRFGYNSSATVTTGAYTIVAGDNGVVKRFSNATGIAVTLPLMTWPFTFLAINDGNGPVTFTASAGDINNDSTLVLLAQEGAFLSLNSPSSFWRGITITGRVQSGIGVPTVGRCDQAVEAGQVYVRTDAAAVNASLYICSSTGAGVFAWEGPFSVGAAGGVTSFAGRAGVVVPASGDYTIAQVTDGASVAAGNSFAAGATQVFTPSVTASGLQLACADLPSAPTVGSMACDSAGGLNVVKFWNGTAWISSGYALIQDEGVSLPTRPTTNYTGAGVACADDPGNNRTNCAISGGGPGTGLNSLTGTTPIVTGGTLNDPTIGFGYQFGATINGSTYTVVSTDAGHVKRFNNSTRVDVTLPLMTFPFSIYLFNDGLGPVVVTLPVGDFNGDTSFVLQNQEGAFLSLNQSAAFYRGIFSAGRVQSGTGVPVSTRCNEIIEAGQVYVRTDAGTANSSLYICALTTVGGYTWEGPFAVTGGTGPPGATQFSDLADFKAVATSSNTLTITAGLAAVGNYPFPAAIGGAVTFSAGVAGGIARVFLDEDGILVTEGTTGVAVSALTGQMTFRNSSAPTVPDTAIPLCDLTVTSAAYAIVSCTQGTRLRGSVNKAGTGLLKVVANGKSTFSVDPAAVCMTSGNCGGTATGAGAPSAASCTSATVGSPYTDTNIGGDDWRCRKIAAATYLWLPAASPGAAASLRYRDDLVAGVNVSGNGSDGNLQLAQVGTGTLAHLAGEVGHYGLRRYTSGTVLDNNGGAILSAGQNLFPNLTSPSGFFARLILRTDPTSITNAAYCAGFCGSGGTLLTLAASTLAGLVHDKGAGHTTWHLRTANTGTATGTDTDTGVTVTTAQWADVAIWSLTAGTICYSLNGAAEVCHSANLSTTAQSLAILSATRAAASGYAVDIDLMELTMWGLSR